MKYLGKAFSTEKSEGEEKCRLVGIWMYRRALDMTVEQGQIRAITDLSTEKAGICEQQPESARLRES
jgi:hypothetical protein